MFLSEDRPYASLLDNLQQTVPLLEQILGNAMAFRFRHVNRVDERIPFVQQVYLANPNEKVEPRRACSGVRWPSEQAIIRNLN